MTRLTALTILTSILLYSCSVEKRLYNKGFFIQKNQIFSSNQKKTEIKDVDVEIIYTSQGVENMEIIANLSNEVQPNYLITEQVFQNNQKNQIIQLKPNKKPNTKENCDYITTKSGDEIQCIVKEITSSEIKYLKCNNANSPLISIRKSEVLFIKYANGEKEVISSPSSSDPVAEQIMPSNGGKSQLVAFLLCFFFGVLGIHRFYLGHIGMGILYLLTGGLCGIGALIDFILILTGSMKPKDGEYEKTF